MKKLWCSKVMLAAVLSGMAGCSTFHDNIVSTEMKFRDHVLAQQAWNEWSWCYDELSHPFHFARGFKAGYRDILAGGNGCQPTLPPREYWKPQFQNPEGRCMVNAWFDGFAHGALAAQQDGYGSLTEIPISPTARMNLEAASAHHRPGSGAMHYGTATAPAAAVPATPVPTADNMSGTGTGAAPLLPPVTDTPNGVRPYEE